MQRKESNGRRREELPWALKKESKKGSQIQARRNIFKSSGNKYLWYG